MQDYEFWGNGHLSQHLLRQLSLGARVIVMTTPPPGKTGGGEKFKEKLSLLEELDRSGAEVFLNTRIHAKAYLFQDDKESELLIVGSPNLTSSGFGTRGSNSQDLLELALLTEDPLVFSTASQLIQDDFIGHPETLKFATWVTINRSIIAHAKGPS